MTGLPIVDLMIVVVVLLTVIFIIGGMVVAFIIGGMISSRAYKDAAPDRADFRQEKRSLAEENGRLKNEIFELRKRVVELEGQLRDAMYEINKLSATFNNLNLTSAVSDEKDIVS